MKYFLFDIGHVLVDFDFQDLMQYIADASGRPVEPLTERDHEMHYAVETGQISDAEWLSHLNEAKGLSWNEEELINLWSQMFRINQAGRSLYIDMIKADVPVYLLSNIAEHHVKAINKNWDGFFDDATEGFLSYQMGARKPDPVIYRKTLEMLSAEGEQCFFIDDREENIEAACAEGIHAHQFIPDTYSAVRDMAMDFFGVAH